MKVQLHRILRTINSIDVIVHSIKRSPDYTAPVSDTFHSTLLCMAVVALFLKEVNLLVVYSDYRNNS